jgi:hypothetical protein
VRIVIKRTERCSRDGGRLAFELEVEVGVDAAVREGGVDEKVIV